MNNCAVSIFVSGNNSDKLIAIFKDIEQKQKDSPLTGYKLPDVGISSLYEVKVWDRNNILFYTKWGITVGEIDKLAMKLKVTYLELSWEVAGDVDAGGFAIFENGFKTVEQHIYLSDYIATKFDDGSVKDVFGNMWESESLLLEYILRNTYGLKTYCDSTEPDTFDILYSFEDCIQSKGFKMENLSDAIEYAKDKNQGFWEHRGLEVVQVINNRNQAIEFEIIL